MIKEFKFTEIFNDTIKLYPDSIYIGDGRLTKGNGGIFPHLSNLEENIQELNLFEDNLYNCMSWVILTCLSLYARKVFKKGIKFIYKYDIDFKYLRKRFYNSYISEKSLKIGSGYVTFAERLKNKEVIYIDDCSKKFIKKWKKQKNYFVD